jgi:hypothetical protein
MVALYHDDRDSPPSTRRSRRRSTNTVLRLAADRLQFVRAYTGSFDDLEAQARAAMAVTTSGSPRWNHLNDWLDVLADARIAGQ